MMLSELSFLPFRAQTRYFIYWGYHIIISFQLTQAYASSWKMASCPHKEFSPGCYLSCRLKSYFVYSWSRSYSWSWQLLSGAGQLGQGDTLVRCTRALLWCKVSDFCPLQCKRDPMSVDLLILTMYLPAFFFLRLSLLVLTLSFCII